MFYRCNVCTKTITNTIYKPPYRFYSSLFVIRFPLSTSLLRLRTGRALVRGVGAVRGVHTKLGYLSSLHAPPSEKAQSFRPENKRQVVLAEPQMEKF